MIDRVLQVINLKSLRNSIINKTIIEVSLLIISVFIIFISSSFRESFAQKRRLILETHFDILIQGLLLNYLSIINDFFLKHLPDQFLNLRTFNTLKVF